MIIKGSNAGLVMTASVWYSSSMGSISRNISNVLGHAGLSGTSSPCMEAMVHTPDDELAVERRRRAFLPIRFFFFLQEDYIRVVFSRFLGRGQA